MSRNKAAFVVIFGVIFAVISTANGVPAQSLIKEDNKQFQAVRNMFKGIAEEGTVPNNEITWNPTLITDNPLLTQLCKLNIPGNYQNPFNCNQLIMCCDHDDDVVPVYLWTCPGGGIYDPIPDMCVYPISSPEQEQCPWPSIWTYPDIRCETLGQRFFWSPLTFPLNPAVSCGDSTDFYYCSNSETVGTGNCPPGSGYSKAYLACLPIDKCIAADTYFNYPVLKLN